MQSLRSSARLMEPPSVADKAESHGSPLPQASRLIEIGDDGTLFVEAADGSRVACDWLMSAANAAVSLACGDELLVLPMSQGHRPVVLGVIGCYEAPIVSAAPDPHVVIEATESLTLKCGDASIDLRADGKVMIRGEDVLVRAKGTQRIRAGTVSIN